MCRTSGVTASVMIAFAVVACDRSGAKLNQPVGMTTVSSAPVYPRAAASNYSPPSIELYIAEQIPGPCGMDRIPPVEFEFGSSAIAPVRDLEITRLAQCFLEGPFASAPIILVGHADPIGSSSYNLDLAYERSARVKERLIELGVPPLRLTVASAGEARLPRERWDVARRVDIVLARPGATAAPQQNRR